MQWQSPHSAAAAAGGMWHRPIRLSWDRSGPTRHSGGPRPRRSRDSRPFCFQPAQLYSSFALHGGPRSAAEDVAQLAEQRPFKPRVEGSSPSVLNSPQSQSRRLASGPPPAPADFWRAIAPVLESRRHAGVRPAGGIDRAPRVSAIRPRARMHDRRPQRRSACPAASSYQHPTPPCRTDSPVRGPRRAA